LSSLLFTFKYENSKTKNRKEKRRKEVLLVKPFNHLSFTKEIKE
jgi:hypothetical protein